MRLSRTARFLIAALLVAAAAFVWVNFFNQNGLSTTPTVATAPTPGPITVGEGAAPLVGQPADAAAEGEPVAAPEAAEGGEAPAPAAGAAQQGATPLTPPVVVAEGTQVVTRDLVVEELPFLVLAPPSGGPADDPASGASASRPQATQRATINPFSPVVVQAPPAAAPVQEVAQEQPPASTPIVEVVAEAPAGRTTQPQAAPAPEPVRAPAPRAVAPASSVSSDLPRALPTGMLPTSPQILRDARSQPAAVAPVAPNIGDLAALREPGSETPVPVAPVDAAAVAATAATVPDPLGPGRPLSQPVQADARPANTLPLAVGADPLSRYLRDNDVRFTGTVLGPLSVGVFRSSIYSTPVVLTLGQPLPDTDIILSDLRGYEARFTQGDRTQTLSLDLRR